MPVNPKFDDYVRDVGPKDVEEFLMDETVTEEDKTRFKDAEPMVQRRLVAGWMIRTNRKLSTESAKKRVKDTPIRPMRKEAGILADRDSRWYKNGPVKVIDPATGLEKAPS